jgi:hypothetical protein
MEKRFAQPTLHGRKRGTQARTWVADCGSFITGTSFTKSPEVDLKRNIVQALPGDPFNPSPAPSIEKP